jgi:autotransporter translocation and assembly factor TamB
LKHNRPTWLRPLYLFVFSAAVAVALTYFAINAYTTRMAVPLIEGYAQRQGIELKIKKIYGWFPIRAEIASVSYASRGLGSISLENVRIELFKIPVLRRRLRIAKLQAQKAAIISEKGLEENKRSSAAKWPAPFFGLEFKNLSISETSLRAPGLEKPVIFALDSTGFLERGAERAELSAKILQKAPFEEKISLNFKALKRTRHISAHLSLSESQKGWAHELLAPTLEVKKANLDITLSGHISSWLSWARGKVSALSKAIPRIKGSVKGSLQLDRNAETSKNPWVEAFIGSAVKLSTDFGLSSSQTLHFTSIRAKSSTAHIEGDAKLNFIDRRLRGANLEISFDHLPALLKDYNIASTGPLKFALKVGGPLDALEAKLSTYKQKIRYADFEFDNLSGDLSLVLGSKGTKGEANFFCYVENRRFDLEGAFETPDNTTLSIEKLNLTSSSDRFSLTGTYAMDKDAWLGGHVDLDAKRFSFFNQLTGVAPDELIVGRIRAGGNFDRDQLQWSGKISQLEYGDFYARECELSGSIHSPLKNPHGSLHMYIIAGAAGRLLLPNVTVQTGFGSKKNPFSIHSKSEDSSVEFDIEGAWKQSQDHTEITFEKGVGKVDNSDMALKEASRLSIENGDISLTPLIIETEGGQITLHNPKINPDTNTQAATDWELNLNNVPAALLRLGIADLKADGRLQGKATWSPQPVKADIDLEVSSAYITYKQWPIIENRTAILKASMNAKDVIISSDIKEGGRNRLSFSAEIPAEVSLSPFNVRLIPDASFKARFKADENAANFLQYLNSAGHALGGHLVGQMQASGSLDSPLWSGALSLSKGRYENFQTGMILKNVDIDLVGSGSDLDLKKLTATDTKKGPNPGRVTAHGSITASPTRRFPYQFSALFENAMVLNIEDVKASTSGLATIKGDLDRADITAKLTVTSAQITIPDTIKGAPPSLDITFLHGRQRKYGEPFDFSFAKKINLDITLDTESGVEVSGRGLQSKWSGSVETTGTIANPNFRGKLSLSDGSFKFASITFNLTEGVMTFNGAASKTGISLVAEQAVGDLNVYIALRGPLIAPHLTLSSSPDMPMSNLLSRLLFNKDISEIDPFQALQLAQTAIQLQLEAHPNRVEMRHLRPPFVSQLMMK